MKTIATLTLLLVLLGGVAAQDKTNALYNPRPRGPHDESAMRRLLKERSRETRDLNNPHPGPRLNAVPDGTIAPIGLTNRTGRLAALRTELSCSHAAIEPTPDNWFFPIPPRRAISSPSIERAEQINALQARQKLPTL